MQESVEEVNSICKTGKTLKLEVSFMQDIIAKLTAKDDKYACAIADKIISESQDTDSWYEYFDAFASLLNHSKS